ncbi:MAG: 2-phosphosulfolactate phosphatase [Nocardioides sp.]|jgi:2-phosphosulfolactate phosphatase
MTKPGYDKPRYEKPRYEKPGYEKPGHDQAGFAIRCEWGPDGAKHVPADIAVVVDVLSFTTTVTVAVERGIAVLPYAWKDDRAAAYARSQHATLAIGRLEALERPGAVSLSPASMAGVTAVDRIVLPSPNGSTISALLTERANTVVAASLRNAAAVGAWVAGRVTTGESVVVVPAGERWPDDTLRPAVEDLWGAGAVIAAALQAGATDASPEALAAAAAWRDVRPHVTEAMTRCAGGIELIEAGFGADVAIAAQADASGVVPMLRDGAFTA